MAPFSSAYTLPTDVNPVPFMTHVADAPKDAFEAISRMSESVVDESLGNYHIIRLNGGASVLTPRHIMLTDHQAMWQLTPSPLESGSIYLHGADPALHRARIVTHQRTINGGWIILELTSPLISPQPIRIADDPFSFKGQQCLIPIERVSFLRNNPDALPACAVEERGDMLYVQGHILKYAKGEVKRLLAKIPSAFDDENFVIRIAGDFDLHGASGFPVLAYDECIDEWVMIATAISTSYDADQQINLLHASMIDRTTARNVLGSCE